MGVWIETALLDQSKEYQESHPAWVCGLKLVDEIAATGEEPVTPCVGVWIETEMRPNVRNVQPKVTPCVGVWIETDAPNRGCCAKWSHPAWVCGLKHVVINLHFLGNQSHPAWVCGLKQSVQIINPVNYSHTLRGCVD